MGDGTELVPVSSLDIVMPASEALADELDIVMDVLERCRELGSPDFAFGYGAELIERVQAKGVAMAELLYGLSKLWTNFGLDEEFEDRVYAEWGISKDTTHKYIRTWRSVFDNDSVPDDVKGMLKERPMYTLKRLARPARENALTDGDWKKIAKAPTHHEVLKIINNRAGKPRRGVKPVVLLMDKSGQITALHDGKMVVVGILRVDKVDLHDDLRWKAVERIIKGAGILDG